MTSKKYKLDDYNNRYSKYPNGARSRYLLAVIVAVIALLFAVLGVSLAAFIKGRQQNEQQESSTTTSSGPPDISMLLINEYKADNIEANLKVISSKMHRAGTDESLATADWIAQQYRNFGLDIVEQPEYKVLLSYPNNTDTNKIWLVAKNGSETLVSSGLSEHLAPGDDASQYGNVLFNAYGAAGNVTGDLIYVNYGMFADYKALQDMNISLVGKIVLARYGKIWRGAKAQFAQQLGAIGAILYNDPFDFAANFTSKDETFPNSMWLPPKGAQMGSVTYGIENGDFPTPLLPAKDYAYRIPTDQLKDQLVLPKIPITPIGYEDAAKLLVNMGGPVAPPNWQGTAPGVGTYYLGPLKNGAKVHLKVNNYLDSRTIRNTIGYIKGTIEPEKYVLLGNHHDAWIYGAMDPNSGTALIVETARVFKAVMNVTGWRPRRTLVFCSWDSEEYGLHGSDEWVEENMRRLESRAIAYLNVDTAISGNLTMYGAGAPVLQKVMFDSCKKVPNPSAFEYSQGRTTVYDTYKYYIPNPETSDPYLLLTGSGSDFTWFLDYIGVPILDFGYAGLWARDFPLYHTIYEIPWTVSNLLDQGFNYSRAVGQVWAEVARSLADSIVIPFDPLNYATTIQYYVNNLVIIGDRQGVPEIMQAKQSLLEKATQFVDAAKAISQSIPSVEDSKNEIKIRALNEKLQYLERMFIIPKGLPQHPALRHVVFSPSATNAYEGSVFSGVFDALANTYPPQINFLEQPLESCSYNWTETLKEQLSWVTFCIDQAADWLRRDETLTSTPATVPQPDISSLLMNEFKTLNIEANLKAISSKMHRAGTAEGRAIADWIAQQYRSFGLDIVEQPEYNVLLSYPNNTNPNKILLVANDGTETLVSDGLSEYLSPGDNASEYANVLFNGYGAAGDISGDLVYVNYGRFEDYKTLQDMNISLVGKIVIARYGQIFRGAKAQFAQQLGAIGVIIYNDPFDFSSNFTNYDETLPHSMWLPPKGAQRGSVAYSIVNGDFPTPMLPAKDYTYRVPAEELQEQLILPKIPITPIGYEYASKLLMQMEGPVAPPNWQGTAPSVGTYHLGPLKNNTKVHMKVNNYLDTRQIRNTIGYITGAVEPEKYVLLGNHHDAWVYGAMDPNSGTATIVETARVFKAVMNATGWRPRRTLVFCSWDSEEYGLIGSNEWVEENARRLQNRAIAYLNVDPGVSGNLTFIASSVPLLNKIMLDSCKKVPNPDPAEVLQGRTTVYDTYKYYLPSPSGDNPDISLIGSGSDFTRFMDFTGIPVMNFAYIGAWARDFPLYHTMYETTWAFGNLLDQGFYFSRAVGQVWAEIARALADSIVIPFDALNYALNIQQYVKDLVSTGDKQNVPEIIAAKQTLMNKAAEFVQAAKAVNDSISDVLNSKDTIKIRALNEKLQYLERMFLIPKGLPQHPLNRHVVFSPSSTNAYAGSVFSGVFDALTNRNPPQINFFEQPTDGCNYNWTETLKEQLSWVTFCIDQAADWLRRDF